MDKETDQLSNGPGAMDTAFSSSMTEANNAEGSPNAGANNDRREASMGPERRVSESSGGRTPGKIDYPLPPDPHAPPGPDHGAHSDDEISDYGLNESVEVGHDPHVLKYGIDK